MSSKTVGELHVFDGSFEFRVSYRPFHKSRRGGEQNDGHGGHKRQQEGQTA